MSISVTIIVVIAALDCLEKDLDIISACFSAQSGKNILAKRSFMDHIMQALHALTSDNIAGHNSTRLPTYGAVLPHPVAQAAGNHSFTM